MASPILFVNSFSHHFENVPIGGDPYAIEIRDLPTGADPPWLVDHAARVIAIAINTPLDRLPMIVAAGVADAWRQAVTAYGAKLERAWRDFDNITDAVEQDLDGEVDEDCAGDVFASFDRLRRLGIRFDPPFVRRMNELREQARGIRHKCGRRVDVLLSESFIDGDDGDDPDYDSSDTERYAGWGHNA